MSLRIHTNPVESWAGRQLKESQQTLHSSLEKIASGKRINKSKDDASGMVIADSLGSQARGMGQAIKNASDAVSMAQIAEGALSDVSGIIQTIRTKAVEASQGSLGTESRQAIQSDIDNLIEQLDMIAKNTSFNGQKLLSGNFSDRSFQVGTNPNETISLSIDSAESSQLGDNEHGSLTDINVLTQEGAEAAIEVADAALHDVSRTRSEIGSLQNQLTSSIRSLSSAQINILSAESTIRDVDLAEESMILSKMKRLTRIRSFAMAQAKAGSENVMQLLKT
jgi:flagellin